MVGGWIKMRSDLLRAPRLVEISRLLNRNVEFRSWICPAGGNVLRDDALRCVTGALLMRVWSDARSFGNFDGDDLVVPHFTVPDTDLWACAPGVGKAMVTVGWLRELESDGEHNGLVFPNFRQYNAPMEPAEKQSAYRKRKKESVTKPLLSDGNGALPLEEKRVEENIVSPNGDTCNEAKPHCRQSERSKVYFPIRGNSQWFLTQLKLDKILAEYADRLTEAEVLGEFRKAYQWLRDNPARRKTATGMSAFLTRWLNKAWDNKPKTQPNSRAAEIPEGAIYNSETGGYEIPLEKRMAQEATR